MQKIKKIRELKPRIRELKHGENNKKSELVEDIEEAETLEQRQAVKEFANASEFEAPSLVLESNIEPTETQTQTTQIQQATRERQELEEQNAAYATAFQAARESSRNSYTSFGYTSTGTTSTQTTSQTISPTLKRREVTAQVGTTQQFTRDITQERQIRREGERQEYETQTQQQGSRRRRRFPWEV